MKIFIKIADIDHITIPCKSQILESPENPTLTPNKWKQNKTTKAKKGTSTSKHKNSICYEYSTSDRWEDT